MSSTKAMSIHLFKSKILGSGHKVCVVGDGGYFKI